MTITNITNLIDAAINAEVEKRVQEQLAAPASAELKKADDAIALLEKRNADLRIALKTARKWFRDVDASIGEANDLIPDEITTDQVGVSNWPNADMSISDVMQALEGSPEIEVDYDSEEAIGHLEHATGLCDEAMDAIDEALADDLQAAKETEEEHTAVESVKTTQGGDGGKRVAEPTGSHSFEFLPIARESIIVAAEMIAATIGVELSGNVDERNMFIEQVCSLARLRSVAS